MSKLCTACGKPTTDVLMIARLRLSLPYHPECALEAERDLRAMRAGIADALVVARFRDRAPASGPVPRADERAS